MYLRNEKGSTLVELMISMIIISMVLLGFYVFAHNVEDMFGYNEAQNALQQEASLILHDIVKDLREAETITIDDVEGGASNYLLIESTAIGSHSYWSVGNNPFTGHLQGEFYKNDGAADQILLGDYMEQGISLNVADLTFTDNLANNLVTVAMQLQLVETYPDQSTAVIETRDFNASAQPRNR